MKQVILLLITILPITHSFGQTDKKIEEAVKTFNSGKPDKGIAMMEKITAKESTEENWELLVKMYYERYNIAKKNDAQQLAILVGQSMGAKMKQEDYTPTDVCFSELISKCREANLYSQSATASQLLRNYLVDRPADTAISNEAHQEFEEAEKYFGKKDYINARLHYQNALNLQPGFYKATIYIGDSFWYLGNMDSAIHYFRKGIEMHPDQLEPRKYMVDALAYAGKNQEAKKECMEAIYLYPDQSMFDKYEDLLKREEKVFNKHWTKRGCEINAITRKEASTKDPVWKKYQEAEKEITSYCDERGLIVKPNTLTKSKYLEVYAWEKMLSSTTSLPGDLAFAKRMADEGFLDCYIFISVFHVDLYGQYADFVKGNQERIKTYIETYLVEKP